MSRWNFLQDVCCVFGLLLLTFSTPSWAQSNGKLDYEVKKIWDEAPHSAFTDLTFFDGKFFCTFREGTGHVPGTSGKDGTIRVITSPEGKTWSSFASLSEAEVDLRDPKLSITADGRLMLLIGGSYYDGTTITQRGPRVCFLETGETSFGKIEPIQIDESIRSNFDWLWRVTWNEKRGYGVMYQSNQARVKFGLHLVSTTDGVNYERVKSFEIDGSPNEATLRFLNEDTIAMLLRREGDDHLGYFGKAKSPFQEWSFVDVGQRLGGPDFIVLDEDLMLAGTRKYGKKATTILARLHRDGKLQELAELPSGGDTSYPGFVVRENNLWMSYYASHEGKTSIYLARFDLEDIEKLTLDEQQATER